MLYVKSNQYQWTLKSLILEKKEDHYYYYFVTLIKHKRGGETMLLNRKKTWALVIATMLTSTMILSGCGQTAAPTPNGGAPTGKAV